MLLLECENVFRPDRKSPVTNRQEQILNQFLELLKNNCKKEHKVEFYSDRLFMTPQYLSLVLRNISGKTAYQWIVEGIITEAKILLKDATLNVKQVSETLNFPDASSFGKFFKKQIGISPFKYKNENNGQEILF
jgi:AraC-like DNA-binding protein